MPEGHDEDEHRTATPAAPWEGVVEPGAQQRACPRAPPRTSHGHARCIPSLRAGPLADKPVLSSPGLSLSASPSAPRGTPSPYASRLRRAVQHNRRLCCTAGVVRCVLGRTGPKGPVTPPAGAPARSRPRAERAPSSRVRAGGAPGRRASGGAFGAAVKACHCECEGRREHLCAEAFGPVLGAGENQYMTVVRISPVAFCPRPSETRTLTVYRPGATRTPLSARPSHDAVALPATTSTSCKVRSVDSDP